MSAPLDLLAQRRTSRDFRWASRTWVAAPYFVRGQQKTPKELLTAVLGSETLGKTVRAEASKGHGKTEEEVRKEAAVILCEMGHDFQMYAIRWFALVLSKLGKRLYGSIQVNAEKVDEIRRAYGRYPVLLLPTHRSYVDFLLVSYVSFCFELSLPFIAAGMDFQGMGGVGEALRKSGAFYIRRRFGGDALYWALIREYVQKGVMEGGHPLEMFVEGTRSRSGKPLKPKTGLLAIVAELVLSGQVPDIRILPISISYDRTLEERLYAHELLGKPKPKESTNGLMKALKWVGEQKYGSAYVHLGEVMSMREMLSSSPTLTTPAEAASTRVERMALRVVLEQGENVVVPLFAGVALIMLSNVGGGRAAIPLQWLMESLGRLQGLLLRRKRRFGLPLLGEPFEANVVETLGLHSSLLRLEGRSGEEVVRVAEGDVVEHMMLQHYANQILPPLLPFALMAWLQGAQSASMADDYVFLRELLQDDFLYAPRTLSQELERARGGEWAEIPPQGPTAEPLTWNAHAACPLLSRALDPYLLAYWAVAATLSHMGGAGVGVKAVGKECQHFLLEKMKIGEVVGAYGALSLDTITNAVSALRRLSVVEGVKLEDGSLGLVVVDARPLSAIAGRLGNSWE